ncbi:hypothetical protein [Nitrobacter sp.]|uniref:hypothetical protein n=1 Tax=Nitrobacter sp. TaxID=29420 RepID=UPI003F6545E6
MQVVLTNVSDATKAFGVGDSSSTVLKFQYQKADLARRYRRHLPPAIIGGKAALRGWLEERLAPLAVLEIDLGERRTIFAKTGLATWTTADHAFEVLKVIENFFAEISEEDDDERESEATAGTT